MRKTKTHKTRWFELNRVSFKQIGALILAAVLTVSGAGFAEGTEARAEAENREPAMMAAGAMPDQGSSFGGGGGGEASVSNVIKAGYQYGWFGENPLPPLTEARKREVSEIIENVGLGKDQIPIEEVKRAMKVLWAERLAVYDKQLMEYGCTDPEMRKVCSRWLYCLEGDNSRIGIRDAKGESTSDNANNYVSKQQILEFSVTGKGIDVAYDKDGFPRILLVNMKDKKLKSHFDKAIKFLGDMSKDDVIKNMWENGTNLFFPIKYNAKFDSTVCGASSEGVIYPNVDNGDTKNSRLWFILAHDIMGEVYFFKHAAAIESIHLSTNMGYMEMLKVWLGGYNIAYLYNKSKKNNEELKKLHYSVYGATESWTSDYGVPMNDPFLHRQMELIMESNLAKPLGAENWSFINTEVRRGGLPYLKDSDYPHFSAYAELRAGTSEGQAVLDMKQRLYELGYSRFPTLDDHFTDATADMVKLFEKNNGLPVDGVADTKMLSVLFSDNAVRK